MRGSDQRSGSLFSYVDLERRVRKDHPLRAIRTIVDAALSALSGAFAAMYAPLGRPSIAPEKLLRALLLQAFYTVRSERQLMERLEFDLLFRWFVGLGIDDRVWDHSVFSKNRERLLEAEIAARFLTSILNQGWRSGSFCHDEHFSVDGTLVEAWASLKELQAQEGQGWRRASGIIGTQRRGRLPLARSGATRPTLRPPIRTLGSIARDQAWKPSSASSVTP